jgi:hypothetical protein
MADSLELAPTLSDIGRHPEIVMAAYKPEAVITQERHEISARFQRILDIFDHARHTEAIANFARYRPTSDRLPEIAMLAIKPVFWPPLLFLVVGRMLGDIGHVGDSSSVLGVIENVWYSSKSRRYLIPFLSYYYFRCIGRHYCFRLSADIGQCWR